MRPAWLIESGVYGDEAAPLLAEIRRQGMTAGVVPHGAIRARAGPVVAGGRPLDPDACVIGYGAYPFAREILSQRRWRPGAWCSEEGLDCSTYYGYFGPFLLNREHAILPGVEAIRRRDELFAAFGRDGRVFVRPAGCDKLIVGRCVDLGSFAAALAPARYDPATRVVVAAPRSLGREWRIIVIDGRVIAGSRYAVKGVRAIDPEFPAEVRAFAEAILAEVRWRPDPAFMLDLGESEGELRLVELNSFSGSWLYRCDLPAVVAAASDLASRTWLESRPLDHRPIAARNGAAQAASSADSGGAGGPP
ncbi:ATP-grasp domain-containing protein [Aquisphaera insulae]|uniref:ATP-grasp domain-containing protein n=1 Tax=Aquisphaera insulae TaxID=2712864 RepID=UPI0013EABF6D|nr:ATP-grasp domain-containing protein [Aquisphaera insulae]